MKSASFHFTPVKSQYPTLILQNLLYQEDFINFCRENAGKSLYVQLEHEVIRSEKKRLYRFLNGVLCPAIVEAKIANGEAADKVSVMIELKALHGKDIYVDKNGTSFAILMSQEDMTKDRLRQFVVDSILYLESEYGISAPDAEYYKQLLSADKNTENETLPND